MATAILSEYRKVIPNAAEPLVKSGILTESNHGNVSANNPQLEHFPPDLPSATSLRSPLAQITIDNISLFAWSTTCWTLCHAH